MFLLLPLLLAGVLVATQSPTQADPFLPLRAQWSAKLVGVSVLPECPTPDVIAQLQADGDAMGADYTAIPEVAGASMCPATRYGPMWGWSQIELKGPIDQQPDAGTWRVRGGVTVGLHYQLRR